MKDIIILDNNPTAYSLNHYNGFPIKSWFDDKNDDELLKICPILEFLSYVPDVRDFIPKFVEDNKINYEKVNEFIKNYKVKEILIESNSPSIVIRCDDYEDLSYYEKIDLYSWSNIFWKKFTRH